jgi:HD-like signal output (HDOD) protein
MSSTTPLAGSIAFSKLPAFPIVAVRLMQLVSKEGVSFVQVSDLLRTDAALSAEVLRAANSPLFGSRSEVKSIPLALATLGLDRLCLLVLTAAMWRQTPGGAKRQQLKGWWRHNLAVALLSKHLTPAGLIAEYGYMAGLMHSVGQLLLFGHFGAEYSSLISKAAGAGRSLLECERESYGTDHCSLGARLLTEWRIPPELVECAACHHDPSQAKSPLAAVVYVSCQIANQLGFTVATGPRKSVDELSEEAKRVLANETLCVAIAEKVEALESSLDADH